MRSARTPPARAMALDVGGRRIGVAIADETGAIASPIAVLQRGHGDLAELARLVREWGVDRLVIGLPTGLSGREGPQAADVRAYAQRLAESLGPELPIEFWDERLTTAIAERALIATGTRRAKRKEQIDAVAAAIILQGYLDAQRHRRARAAGHPP
jgi:putative Holliday junction resolvase